MRKTNTKIAKIDLLLFIRYIHFIIISNMTVATFCIIINYKDKIIYLTSLVFDFSGTKVWSSLMKKRISQIIQNFT